jgi:hypothetical protein
MCRTRQIPGSLIPHAQGRTLRAANSLGIAMVRFAIEAERCAIPCPGRARGSSSARFPAGFTAVGMPSETPTMDDELLAACLALQDDPLQQSSAERKIGPVLLSAACWRRCFASPHAAI